MYESCCDGYREPRSCKNKETVYMYVTIIVLLIALLIGIVCIVVCSGNKTTASSQYVGLSIGQQKDKLPSQQTAVSFSTIDAQSKNKFVAGSSPVSKVTLEANHTYFIAYGVNSDVTNGENSTLSTGILVDGKQATPSISTNTSNSLLSTSGNMILSVGDTPKVVELYTIATGEINLLNAQMSVLQLD